MRGREYWSTPSSSSSTLRFLDNLKLPDPNPDPLTNHTFELHENDVVWSSTTTTLHPIPPSSPPPQPPSLLPHHHTRFSPGLASALSDDNYHPRLQRNSAAKFIPQLKYGGGAVGQSKFHQSAPVNIPMWPNNKKGEMNLDKFDEDDDELDGDDEMVPPHVIVARSHVTFSVFEGVGRTLKGRDLRRVRNAVFQETGFID